MNASESESDSNMRTKRHIQVKSPEDMGRAMTAQDRDK